MSKLTELLKIKYRTCGISYSLTEDTLCIGLYKLGKFLVRKILVNKCALDTHLRHSNAEEIICSAVDG